MAQPPKRRATYEDVLDAPENMTAEILDGELVLTPPGTVAHGHTQAGIAMDVGGPFQRGRGGPGGWWLLPEVELRLGDDVLVPDVAGWRRERMPSPPASTHIELPPDWLTEILSPSTARIDRVKKLRIYARAGVSHVWLVDPEARTLEVFRRSDANWLLVATHAGDEKIRAEPFEAVEIELGALWLPEELIAGARSLLPIQD